MNFTIILCTHNRRELLEQTIQSINRIRIPDQVNVSLFVVANACSDDTVSYLAACTESNNSAEIHINFIEEPRAGKSFALNRAINETHSEFLCFVDDDHRVDEDYIRNIVFSINKQPDCCLFCGQIIPDWTGSEPEWVHKQGIYKVYPLPVPNFSLGEKQLWVSESVAIPGGGNLIVHRSVFSDIGNFNTNLGPKGHNLSGSEDTDFVLRALKSGYKIFYNPEIKQYHYVDPNRLRTGYLIKKSFQRNRYLTLAKHPSMSLPPLYLWRNFVEHATKSIFAFDTDRRRFYLMRAASTMGEILGYAESR